MIEIKEVQTKRERRQFVELPLKMYKGNPYFVPPLYGDEMKMFRKDYVYNDQSESGFFLCYKDGKAVGRIQTILQRVSNEKQNEKRVRFTRFDCPDDQEVANALFDTAAEWSKKRGMDELVGPLGYSDLEREGLLIEGFEELSTFEEQYNFPYYQKLIENYGFEKDVDWIESNLRAPEKTDDRIPVLCERIMKKYNLRIGESKNTNDFLKRYADSFFEILDKTYEPLYGTVPFTDGMKKMLIQNFKLIIDTRYVAVILDETGKVVCFGLCFPSIAKAVQKSGGRLTPAAIIRLLKAIKRPKTLDLGLIGVLPEYRMKGVSTILIWEIMKMLKSGIESAETNLNLEDNLAIQNQWKIFDARRHKRRRSFKKKI